tara:strand:- start:2611 stop:3264 length:654 start_codon:yes stop_codon:yes gene_type:complete
MKKTKLIITALLGFFINAASAETYSLGTKYASDYFFRGSLMTQESIQADLGVNGEVFGLDYSANAFTNQSVESGVDTYILNAGLSTSFFGDLLETYAGIGHIENVSGEALMEASLRLSIDTLLSPTVSFFRNLDESLYTSELSLSHDLDLDFASLGILGSIGISDLTNSNSETYYSLGANASRSIAEKSQISFGVERVDSNLIEAEYVFALGVSTQF